MLASICSALASITDLIGSAGAILKARARSPRLPESDDTILPFRDDTIDTTCTTERDAFTRHHLVDGIRTDAELRSPACTYAEAARV
jgi:hypothetical protein